MKALIIVDVQYDFLKGGNLEVPKGDEIIPQIKRIIRDYDIIIFTQDWHPENHKSFYTQHKGKKPFEMIQLNGTPQVLWNPHCIQHTKGADIHREFDNYILDDELKIYTFQKGTNPEVDSYSGFYDNDHKSSTGLSEFLKERGVNEIHIVGLATDYCCKFTAIDGVNEGFKTVLIANLCRGIANDLSPVYDELKNEGVEIINV